MQTDVLHAARLLLALCSSAPPPVADFRAEMFRLLEQRGGLTEVAGESCVRAEILRATLQAVVKAAREQLPPLPAEIEQALDAGFERISTEVGKLFTESLH